MPKKDPVVDIVEIYQDSKDEYRWTAKAANGKAHQLAIAAQRGGLFPGVSGDLAPAAQHARRAVALDERMEGLFHHLDAPPQRAHFAAQVSAGGRLLPFTLFHGWLILWALKFCTSLLTAT